MDKMYPEKNVELQLTPQFQETKFINLIVQEVYIFFP